MQIRVIVKKTLKAMLNYTFNNVITHLPIRIVRVSFLRLFNRNIHSSAVILMHTRILNFWNITVNKGVVINQYCVLDCRNHKIIIGHQSDIGPYSRVWTSGHSPDSETHNVYGGDVYIGHHVWIASGVTVLPNLTIADGTVIAAGAVLHKSTSEKDILAGNPARFLKKRNNTLGYEMQFNPILE